MHGRPGSVARVSLVVLCVLVGIFCTVGLTAMAERWEIETVDSMGDVGESTSLALDSSDFPHISFYDVTNTALKYARWDGGTWHITTVDSAGNVGRFSSLALDTNDNAHISYFDSVNQNLKYATWTGTEWQTEIVDSGGEVGAYSSIAVDDNFHVHISYYNGTVDLVTRVDALKYAHWDGSSWSIETIDYALDVGRFTSIALDDSNHPHISYIDCTDNTLKYTRWTGSEWDTSTITSANRQNEWARDYGSGTSLALDSNDCAHIVFVSGIRDYLKYARWEEDHWEIENVSFAKRVYLYVSVALDNSDFPHITYFTRSHNTIDYARWNGTAWNIFHVDDISGNAEGGFNSLALDSSGYAHISYFEYYINDLKYARLVPSNETLEPVDPNDIEFLVPTIIPPPRPPPPTFIVNISVSEMELAEPGTVFISLPTLSIHPTVPDIECPYDIDFDGRPNDFRLDFSDQDNDEPGTIVYDIYTTEDEMDDTDTDYKIDDADTDYEIDAADTNHENYEPDEPDQPVTIERQSEYETENSMKSEQSTSFSNQMGNQEVNDVSMVYLHAIGSLIIILLSLILIIVDLVYRRTTPKS